MDIVGIIPAAGRGTRLGMPFSKELFPLPSGYSGKVTSPVIDFILERMRIAGATKIYTIINTEKTDILAYLGSGSKFGLEICYLIQEKARGMPDAINTVTRWIHSDTIILFGMPDTVFTPENALNSILNLLLDSRADLVLGLFPTNKPHYFGMVEFDENYRPLAFIDKPKSSNLKFFWGIGCWKFTFMRVINQYIEENINSQKEMLLSDVFKFALYQNLDILVYPFHEGKYYDIGIGSEILGVIRSMLEA
ncbi:MAG: sugar phosphate nucleotidyltransferase [Thermosphaera sp.]